MYDPIETDISYQYLIKLKDANLRVAVIGGWAVYFHVKEEYQKAFGKEYLKSRDIDIFIDAKDEADFYKIIKGMGFWPSSYGFRYELIYDREKKEIISHEKAKTKHIFNLAYIFLYLFSDKKTKKLGSWVLPYLAKSKIEMVGGYPVLDADSLLRLKMNSFFEREKLDKELKDACDIYALLFYSGKRFKLNIMIRKTVEKILSRPDLQDYIAEHVLGDSLSSSLVVRKLKSV